MKNTRAPHPPNNHTLNIKCVFFVANASSARFYHFLVFAFSFSSQYPCHTIASQSFTHSLSPRPTHTHRISDKCTLNHMHLNVVHFSSCSNYVSFQIHIIKRKTPMLTEKKTHKTKAKKLYIFRCVHWNTTRGCIHAYIYIYTIYLYGDHINPIDIFSIITRKTYVCCFVFYACHARIIQTM